MIIIDAMHTGQAVKNEYEKKGAILQSQGFVDFVYSIDSIAMKIPMEGIHVQGWTITPLLRPVVSRYEQQPTYYSIVSLLHTNLR